MKRLHVHVGVERPRPVDRLLFDPVRRRADRGEGRLRQMDARRSAGQFRDLDGPARGARASSISASRSKSASELAEVYGRLKAADRPVLEEGATTCCYAKSEKSWIADPDGVVWEAFHTDGEATVYGDSPALGTARQRARPLLRARDEGSAAAPNAAAARRHSSGGSARMQARLPDRPPLARRLAAEGARRLLPVRHGDRLRDHGRESGGRERRRRLARQHARDRRDPVRADHHARARSRART